jgi:hypothetical protein
MPANSRHRGQGECCTGMHDAAPAQVTAGSVALARCYRRPIGTETPRCMHVS